MMALIFWTALALTLTFPLHTFVVYDKVLKPESKDKKNWYKLIIAAASFFVLPLRFGAKLVGVWAATKAIPLWIEFVRTVL